MNHCFCSNNIIYLRLFQDSAPTKMEISYKDVFVDAQPGIQTLIGLKLPLSKQISDGLESAKNSLLYFFTDVLHVSLSHFVQLDHSIYILANQNLHDLGTTISCHVYTSGFKLHKLLFVLLVVSSSCKITGSLPSSIRCAHHAIFD